MLIILRNYARSDVECDITGRQIVDVEEEINILMLTWKREQRQLLELASQPVSQGPCERGRVAA